MKNVRTAGWIRIKKAIKKTIHHLILQYIYLGLHSVSHQHEFKTGPVFGVNKKILIECNMEENEIGWAQLYLDRLSKQWGYANKQLLAGQGCRGPDAQTWMTTIIKEFWKYSIDLWNIRNLEEHGKTNAISLAERDATAKSIRIYYSELKHKIKRQDEWLFQKLVKRKQSISYTNQVAWLDLTKKVCIKEINYIKLSTQKRFSAPKIER